MVQSEHSTFSQEPAIVAGQPMWLQHFITTYQQLGVDDLTSLATLYDDDVVFIDPLHQLHGKAALLDYFSKLYTHLLSCQFEISSVLYSQEQAAVYWQMRFQHPKLKQGNLVTVTGHSHLKGIGDQVTYHRDYLDAGAMLYEHIPLLGRAIKFIKKRAVL